MKRFSLWLIVFAFTGTANAGVPDFITYSGRITDGSYDGLSAQATITFRLFDAAEGGAMLWEHEEAVVVQDGYFSVMLGAGVDGDDQPKVITAVFAEHAETWMELAVGGQVLLERSRIGSVPYAVQAKRTEVVHGSRRCSLGAVFVGTTQAKISNVGSFDLSGKTSGRIEIPDIAIGIQAGQKACQIAFGSPTAHMCTTEEINRSFLVGHFGMAENEAWVHSNSVSYAQIDGANYYFRDCEYWTQGSKTIGSGYIKGTIITSNGYLGLQYCDLLLPVACCDFSEEE